MDGFWIVLSGTGGELTREFVKTEDEISSKLIHMITDLPLGVGDKIEIVDGWSEQD